MKKYLAIITIIILCMVLASCVTSKTENSDGGSSSSSSEQNKSEEKKTYGLNETVDVMSKGKKVGTVTINSAKITSYRNQFSEEKPAQVFIIDYTYENIDYDGDIYIFSSNFNVVDESNNVCSSYPALLNKYPQKTPKGAKCAAQAAFGTVANSSKVTLNYHDELFESGYDVVFEVPLS